MSASAAAASRRWRIPALIAVLLGLGLTLAGCGINNIPTFEEQSKA